MPATCAPFAKVVEAGYLQKAGTVETSVGFTGKSSAGAFPERKKSIKSIQKVL